MTEKQWDRFSLITGTSTVGLLVLLVVIELLLRDGSGDGIPKPIATIALIVISILGFLFVLSAFRKESGEKHVTIKTVLQTIVYILVILAVLFISKKLRGN